MLQAASEEQLHSKLNGAWTVCIDRMQERTRRNATGIACGERFVSKAADHIVARIAWPRRIVDAELRVIGYVERLKAKLQGHALSYGEVLRKRYVEICAARIVQIVSSGIAEGKSRWRDKQIRISNQRTEDVAAARAT